MNPLAATLVILTAVILGSAAVAGLLAGSAYWWDYLIAIGLALLCALAVRGVWRHHKRGPAT